MTDGLFGMLEEIAPDDGDGITNWLGSLQTSGSTIGTVATTEQSARSGRNSANTTTLNNLKATLKTERSAAETAVDRLYRNTEQSAWNTYTNATLTTRTSYIGSIKTAENTYKTAVDTADSAFDTTTITAYSAFNAEACRLTGLYYDALNLAQNGSGITSTFFNDGSSSVNFEVCFVAGTPVLLADGTSKPIEKILSGDMVLAVDYEHSDSIPKPSRVTRVFHNAPQATWKLTLVDGQTIQCTKEHPFYVIERGWTSAENLDIGDHLIRPDGSTISLSAKEYVGAKQLVFNFDVENDHTSFVGETKNTPVLVHNVCMGDDFDKAYGDVYIWTNPRNAPGNPGYFFHDNLNQFNFNKVREEIGKVLKGQPFRVVVIKATGATEKDIRFSNGIETHHVGFCYDRVSHISNYPPEILWGRPLGWIAGSINAVWYVFTRKVESFGCYVTFGTGSGNNFLANAGVVYCPRIYPSSFKRAELLPTGEEVHFNEVAYANIIVHECFYHCLLGEIDDIFSEEGSFTNPRASPGDLLVIPDDWMEKIRDKLRR